MRILIIVRGLNLGGCERQVTALARGLRRNGHHVAVAVFYGGGVFEDELRADGIAVHDLSKRGRWDTVPVLARLVRLIRSERPDVVDAYMGLANLFAALAKPLCPPVPVVWGIRTAIGDVSSYGWATWAGTWLERLASPLADAIVTNSHAARERAVAMGMDARKIVVIPNGIDCERFRFDLEARARLRAEWGVHGDAPLVGIVARLDPVKGHAVFLRAAARLARSHEGIRFVCIGDGDPSYRDRLRGLAEELGISSCLSWAGSRRVTREVYSALDVAVLSSGAGESFPNTLGEAMACGRPCVVTDTGDVRSIVGDTAAVVPPGDDAALARGIAGALERSGADGGSMSAATRARIEAHYSVDLLVRRTEAFLDRVRRRAWVG